MNLAMNLYIAIALSIFGFLLLSGLVFSRLYRRSSKEVSFVRTGFGGQKVIMNGGALVFPVLHEIIPVNMNTLRLEVRRHADQALITHDRMRVDVQAEFYVRVQPTVESIANAAQTLGQRTMRPQHLKELVEGKFVDALRAVAAEMAMEELHEQRVDFVQKVQAAVSEDILKNGLELESVSLTGLDQTSKEFFNPDNAFDAEGLTKLTEEIEARRKKRNDIEQDTEVEIRRAEQSAQIAREQAEREQEAEQAQIAASQQVREAAIVADRAVTERDIQKNQAVEAARVEKVKQVELAQQDSDIAVAEKSRAKSEADALADEARAIAARAAEQVVTMRETEVAQREKEIELIEARQAAEKPAISIKVAAEAEKIAAGDRAAAVKIEAEASAEQERIIAEGKALAEKLRAEALKAIYAVEAEGKRSVNEAANVLSPEQIAMQVKQALIDALPDIIEQQVKPMEQIDGIKILHVDGLNGVGNNGGSGGASETASGGGGVADQAVNAALRYRAQAPLLDALLGELGLADGDLSQLSSSLTDD